MKSFAGSIHVLGLEDSPDVDQNLVYEEFKEQLVRSLTRMVRNRSTLEGKPSNLTLQQAREFEALGRLDEKIREAGRHVAKV